jgi:hypothetical protein
MAGTIYCVKFDTLGKTWFAVKSRKPETPEGVLKPEVRCAFKKKSVAEALCNQLKRESTFSNIRVMESQIK